MATALEQFVNNVRTLSAEDNFKELGSLLPKFSEILGRNNQHLDTVLETLNLQQHSMGYLAVLCAKLTNININMLTLETFKPLHRQIRDFILGSTGEQVRLVTELFADLCHQYANILVHLNIPIRGIDLLCKAIRKIQLFESQLTSIHADLCKLCLLSKCMKPALEFLNVDVTAINIEDDVKYFLLYYYYGGMIYTALKNYESALYFFEVCIVTPATALSHIMIEAYKKFLLISLILNGKVLPLPNYTSSLIKRHIKRLSQSYQELAVAYALHNCDQVQNYIEEHVQDFEKDNNMGLAKQVLTSLYKKNIQRLTNTFLTLSLSDVAARVQLSGPSEAEKYILNMIEDGEIYATINQKDGMVIFHDDPEKYDSPEMLAKLEKEMAECAELGKKVLEMEEEVLVTPQYIRKACGQADQDEQATGTPPITVSNVQNQPKHTTYSM